MEGKHSVWIFTRFKKAYPPLHEVHPLPLPLRDRKALQHRCDPQQPCGRKIITITRKGLIGVDFLGSMR